LPLDESGNDAPAFPPLPALEELVAPAPPFASLTPWAQATSNNGSNITVRSFIVAGFIVCTQLEPFRSQALRRETLQLQCSRSKRTRFTVELRLSSTHNTDDHHAMRDGQRRV
jgi:hypothetical protein